MKTKMKAIPLNYNMNVIFTGLLFFLFLTTAHAQESCSPALIKQIKNKDSQLEVCQITSNLYRHKNQETRNAFIIENFTTAQGELRGITVSIWVLKKDNLPELNYPIYQESDLGQKLLDFSYLGKKGKIVLADINNDGIQDFVINAWKPPHANLIIKGHDSQRERFESLGYRQKDHGRWNQYPYFISGLDSEIEMTQDKIIIKLPDETLNYRLRGSQYEIE